MSAEILYRPSGTIVKLGLQPGENWTAESGSMVAMSGHVDVETSTHKRGGGSLLRSAKRLFAGESFFLNHFSARTPGEVWLSTPLPGDLQRLEITGQTWIVQSGSFLACASSVDINVGWQGFKNFFSGESLFWLKLSGHGLSILSSFGQIYEVNVDGEYIVDTGHIVAFEESLNFSLSKAGSSWIGSFLGGEGIVCRFKGKGRLLCQSHNQTQFGTALTPYLKPKKR
jgi:uncharacterized protein (TIGR00266 family)